MGWARYGQRSRVCQKSPKRTNNNNKKLEKEEQGCTESFLCARGWAGFQGRLTYTRHGPYLQGQLFIIIMTVGNSRHLLSTCKKTWHPSFLQSFTRVLWDRWDYYFILFFFKREVCLLFKFLFIYLFIYGCVGSSFLCEGFLQLRQAGATLHRGARASHYRGLSCCGAQAPDAQAQ